MNEDGQMTTAKSVRFERLLPGPIERVWEYLTETNLLPGWFGEGVIQHRSGGEVRLMGGCAVRRSQENRRRCRVAISRNLT